MSGEATTDFVPLGPLDLPNYGIDQQPFGMEPAHHLFVRYRSSHAFWETVTRPSNDTAPDRRDLWTQHEILLFTRSPEEQFQFFFDFLKQFDLSEPPKDQGAAVIRDLWRQQLSPSLIPGTPTLWYPPNAGWVTLPPNGPLAVFTSEITAQDFWGNALPLGPGAAPVHGSVKAAAITNHGVCANFSNYGGIFNSLDTKLFPKLANLVLAKNSCGSVVKRFSNFVSFVRNSVEAESSQAGGFIANASIQVNALMGGGPNLLLQHAFWFKLVDGRLTVEPQPIFEVGAGTGAGPLRAVAADLLTTSLQRGSRPYDSPSTIAENIWHEADNTQNYSGLSGVGPACATPLDTTFGSAGECKKDGNGNPIVGTGGCIAGFECAGSPLKCRNIDAVPKISDKTDCGTLVDTVRNDVISAAKKLAALPQFNFSQDDINELERTVLETEFDPRLNTQAYKHFRCVPRGADKDYDDTQGSARCEYVLPAKRINVLPDGVELVFVDDTRELKNPAFPIWLHLWSRPPGGMIDPFTLLCNPSTGTMPGEKRSRKYDFLNGPGVAFACANPADCAQCMGNPFCSTCVSGIKGFPWP